MKLLCDLSGAVLSRFSDNMNEMGVSVSIQPRDDQRLVDVPRTVAIPEAIVRVIFSDTNEPEFVMDLSQIEGLWSSIRKRRNELLKESDWICSISDYTPSNKEEWIGYRNALRSITTQPNPYRLVWPIVPNSPYLAPSV